MKKFIVFVFAALLLLLQPACMADGAPITADKLKDGNYSVTVKSSSSMFKIVDCTLTVNGGEMSAVMTLSGTGYEKLYMGKGADAASAPDEDCVYFAPDAEGRYTYTVPVEALDAEIDCAAWSIRKQQWYDRTLVFESASLPDGALKGGLNAVAVCAAAVGAVLIIVCALLLIKKRKSKTA